MEEVTGNNFLFSLTLKLKTLIEPGCLPIRHGTSGSFKGTEKQEEGNTYQSALRAEPKFYT